ncbi:yjeF C-terminal region, hydroxyethylthiazole kinase-related/yjeF N-terminal region [Polaromonas sp. OV174]|uniref:NAD(P)H-hydrate dehydratase n=1 Tax=Polaromonas sp. OV174 TaxID=1855300 RepID=UPI0008E1CD4F|nr:NAD(P)H-hydrate dehydratase [Polaromonas sp. OV174]SFB97170.1 yjeF C-terminal region, hydroxyethylthiazole kinase-related/yjeF N-terminal region [Polaromonas sp. OV174]
MQRISSNFSQPLYSVAATRQLELQAAASLAPHTLMQRAGLAVARLTLALAPHAQHIWVACGPGNNGGDGFEAALQLHRLGKTVVVTWTGSSAGPSSLPPDAEAARQRALAAGVAVAAHPPQGFDFCIDALLGIGGRLDPRRSGTALMLQWLALMQASPAPRLAVDVPTGLDADTGCFNLGNTTKSIAASTHPSSAAATFTLSLLSLKPGLFTASGRDCAGQVWLDDLDVQPVSSVAPSAWLLGADRAGQPPRTSAPHASHKGTFGDVAVLGGQSAGSSHMTGAALLAARAALHAGAGRVFVALLGDAGLTVDTTQAELMFRSPAALDLQQQVVVCGCGGGDAIRSVLAKVLSTAPRAVLDADALNAIATDPQLQAQLLARQGRGYSTVLTPHPLEAARLAGVTSTAVQADRLTFARQLAERFQCVVVLKGSGSVIAAPGQPDMINASGNALLATAGTGDVLAGMLGAYLASGLSDFEAACAAVFAHGRIADEWASERPGQALTASALAESQRR